VIGLHRFEDRLQRRASAHRRCCISFDSFPSKYLPRWKQYTIAAVTDKTAVYSPVGLQVRRAPRPLRSHNQCRQPTAIVLVRGDHERRTTAIAVGWQHRRNASAIENMAAAYCTEHCGTERLTIAQVSSCCSQGRTSTNCMARFELSVCILQGFPGTGGGVRQNFTCLGGGTRLLLLLFKLP